MKKREKLGSKPVNLGLVRQFRSIQTGDMSSFFPPSTFGNRPKCEVKDISTSFGCCHHYEVWCNGTKQWTGSSICDDICLLSIGNMLFNS